MRARARGRFRASAEGDASEAIRPIRESHADLTVHLADSVRAVDRSRWNEVVERSRHASVFHRYEWMDAVETGLECETDHFVVTKDGNTIGLFPNVVERVPGTPFRRLISVDPEFGGPVVTTDVPDSLSLLLDAVSERCTVHRIRTNDLGYLRYNNLLESRGYRPDRSECRFQLDLGKGYDELVSDMSRTRRKGIRRGRNTDYEVVETPLTEESLARFYRVYERVIERMDGELYSQAFFRKLLELRENLLLLVLRIDGEYAGGFLEVLDDERSTVHGFVAAVPEEYFECHASELLYDHVIRWGIEHGYETYDFGGSPADFERGLFRFKAGFGGDLVPTLVWTRTCGLTGRLYDVGRVLTR